MEQHTKIPKMNYFTLLIFVLGAAAFYQVPYLRWTFYDGVMELSGLDNTQFALTMSIYGAAGMIMYFPGGVIADKFSSKKLIPVSLIATGVCGFILMSGPGYGIQLFTYIVLAAAGTLTFWTALNKAAIGLDTSGDGSRMLGLLEGGRGLFQAIFSAIFLAVFGLASNAVGGVKTVLAGYAVLNIVFGILSFFLLEDKKAKSTKHESLHAKDILTVLKIPAVWLLSLVIICSYSFHLGSTYMTPYFTNIIGATAVLSGALAVVRNYIAQMAGAPLGGALAAKTHSSSFIVGIAFIIMTVGIAVIAFLPADSHMMVPLVIFMIIAAISIYIMRGVYFAIISEYGIPLRLTGTAIGVASVIGFTPDIFMNAICGNLLDKYEGIEGYHIIFIIMLVIALIGLAASWTLHFMIIKKKSAATNEK